MKRRVRFAVVIVVVLIGMGIFSVLVWGTSCHPHPLPHKPLLDASTPLRLGSACAHVGKPGDICFAGDHDTGLYRGDGTCPEGEEQTCFVDCSLPYCVECTQQITPQKGRE